MRHLARGRTKIQLPPDKTFAIIDAVWVGTPVREIAREMKLNPDTISRIVRDFDKHVRARYG